MTPYNDNGQHTTTSEQSSTVSEFQLNSIEEAIAEIAKAGFDPVYGARPLKRAIQQELENPLSKALLEGKFAAKDTIKVGLKNGAITFSK